MTGRVQPFTSSLLTVPHAFFSRIGGVSKGLYAELNGGITTEDSSEHIQQNRHFMARYFNVSDDHFIGLKQIHSPKIIAVRNETSFWLDSAAPEADGLVTDRSDLVLTVATADCAPVLFSSEDGKIVGAAHAGWRGAVDGVLEETVKAMTALGASGIRAVIGPCIGPSSYEVASDMRDQLMARHPDGKIFFTALEKEGYFLFDLVGFCEDRLKESGVAQIDSLALDTLQDQRFYSYRRSTLAGEKATGRQISAIKACSL